MIMLPNSDGRLSQKTSSLVVADLSIWIAAEGHPVRVVDGVSFELFVGETLALLGESGSGKSLTALSILGLLPDLAQIVSGQIFLDDVDLLRLPESKMRTVRAQRIAIIFQDHSTSLNPVLTIGYQLIEVIRAHDVSIAFVDAERQALGLLQQVGLLDPVLKMQAYPFQLSGGMKQRVMIAQALAANPDILIADEPTTALDVTTQAQILALLKQLQRERGMTLLLITHDLGVVSHMADRVAVMYAGQIVEQASCHDFFKQPRHPYSKALLAARPERAQKGQLLPSLLGSMPDMSQLVGGCRFADRCPDVVEICRSHVVAWVGEPGTAAGIRCVRAAKHVLSQADCAVDPLSPVLSEPLAIPSIPILTIAHLSVRYPSSQRKNSALTAVHDVSLSILPGKTAALVGESGCGKSSLAKAVMQLATIADGEIIVAGIALSAANAQQRQAVRRCVQMVFQDPFASLNPKMRIADTLVEGMLALDVYSSYDSALKQAERLLDEVGLSAAVLQRYPHEFSGGQRQRIAIARALAVSPQLLILDEPTSALDMSVQSQVLNLLMRLQRERGLAYLFITHNLGVVPFVADHAFVMNCGRIVEHGTASDVLQRPVHPYTQALCAAIPHI